MKFGTMLIRDLSGEEDAPKPARTSDARAVIPE
jgi:hypothetical protein